MSLIVLVAVLIIPAFMMGLGIGGLALIVPLFAAIVIALRPRGGS